MDSKEIYKALGIEDKMLDYKEIEHILVSIMLLVQEEDLDRLLKTVRDFKNTQDLLSYKGYRGVRQ